MCYFFLPATWFLYVTCPAFIPQIIHNAIYSQRYKFDFSFVFYLGVMRAIPPVKKLFYWKNFSLKNRFIWKLAHSIFSKWLQCLALPIFISPLFLLRYFFSSKEIISILIRLWYWHYNQFWDQDFSYHLVSYHQNSIIILKSILINLLMKW